MAPLDGIEAVVLAGGKGRRMAKTYPGVQKVCLPAADKPFLHHVVAQLGANGCRRAVLALGHRADQVKAVVPSIAEATGVSIGCSVEPSPAGTGGAIAIAAACVSSDPVLVANGDSFADIDFGALLRTHLEKRAFATIAVTMLNDSDRFGSVSVGKDGRVGAFREKARASGRGGYANAGVYLLSESALDEVCEAFAARSGKSLSIERDLFPAWCERDFYAVPFDGRFIDIGHPRSYSSAGTILGDV